MAITLPALVLPMVLTSFTSVSCDFDFPFLAPCSNKERRAVLFEFGAELGEEGNLGVRDVNHKIVLMLRLLPETSIGEILLDNAHESVTFRGPIRYEEDDKGMGCFGDNVTVDDFLPGISSSAAHPVADFVENNGFSCCQAQNFISDLLGKVWELTQVKILEVSWGVDKSVALRFGVGADIR